MDKLDLKIVSLWQKNTRLPTETIGEKVGLSASSVQRRIKNLRAQNIIKKEIAIIDYSKIGYPLKFIISVKLKEDSQSSINRFGNKILSAPQVIQCYYITGHFDFSLTVVAQSVEDFDIFTQEYLMSDEDVKTFTTSLVIKDHPQNTPIPF